MRLLKFSVAVLEAGLVLWLGYTEGWTASGILLVTLSCAVAVGAVALWSWPTGATWMLVVASAMPGLPVSLLGLHVRPEHVAIGFVALALMLHHLGSGQSLRQNLRIFDYFLLAYIGMNFFSSIATSPEPKMTFRWAVLNAVAISPYFIFRWIFNQVGRLYKAVHILLLVGIIEAGYGIFCFASNRLFRTTFGIQVGQYGLIPGTYGTQYEANLFGSYTACCAIMLMAFLFLGDKSLRFQYGVGFAITSFGAVISLSRSVLLALPVAALFVVAVAVKKGKLEFRRFVPIFAGVAIILLAASPIILTWLEERFSTINIQELSEDDTTMSRVVQIAAAVQDIQERPLLGSGTASLQLFFHWGDYIPELAGEENAGGWISNSPLRIVHDTGAVGLCIFLGFLAFLTTAARRTAKNADPYVSVMLVALSGGAILYAITFQASEATMLAFTWVHLGLLAALVSVSQPSKKRPVAAGNYAAI